MAFWWQTVRSNPVHGCFCIEPGGNSGQLLFRHGYGAAFRLWGLYSAQSETKGYGAAVLSAAVELRPSRTGAMKIFCLCPG